MPVITKKFQYSGGVETALVPHGTTLLTCYLWGGGGGSGGSDYGGKGGDGAGGHFVSKVDIDMSSYAGVKYISVSVGGGGGGGQQGQNVAGGVNGKSLTNYSGGTGGNSGPTGVSGSGAGGGGATVVTVYSSGSAIDQEVLALAGGGGGAGGAGALSTGGKGANQDDSTARTPATLGENGATHEGDGGGAGAGGGGMAGGKGGSGDTGDIGAFGGFSGSNKVPSGGSEDDGSGKSPGGTSTTGYVTGKAVGGTDGGSGADGMAVLVFTIDGESKVYVDPVTTSYTSTLNDNPTILGYFNNIIQGTEKKDHTFWMVIDPPLSTVDIWQQHNEGGFADQDLIVIKNGVTETTSTNETLTTITKDHLTYTRGSLVANETLQLTYIDASTSTHNFKAYSYSITASGGWKDITNIYNKVAGVWKEITGGYYKVSGVWKSVFTKDILFQINFAAFGDATGNTTSGSDGVEGSLAGVSSASVEAAGGEGGGRTAKPAKGIGRQSWGTIGGVEVVYSRGDNSSGCFVAGTLVSMMDGSAKPVEEVDLGDQVAVGGKVFAVGKFLVNDLHDYKGIKVAGNHMVNEDNLWVNVRDSKHGVPLGDEEHTVHIFACENRRILINGIMFADYFDGVDQEGLKVIGEKYFEECYEHKGSIDKHIVDLLNKK